MKVYRLVRLDFDGMENRSTDALRERHVATFLDNPNGQRALPKIEAFLREYGKEEHYVGWDFNVYPQFQIREEPAK